MSAKTIGAEELADLALYLRAAEFPSGSQQLIRAQELLLAAADQGTEIPRHDLGPWLAPIFSTNQAEQERFRDLYTRWQLRAPREDETDPVTPVLRQVWRWRWPAIGLLLASSITTSIFIYRVLHRPLANPSVDTSPAVREEITASGLLRGNDDKPVWGALLLHDGRKDESQKDGSFVVSGRRNTPVLITHTHYDALLMPLQDLEHSLPPMQHKLQEAQDQPNSPEPGPDQANPRVLPSPNANPHEDRIFLWLRPWVASIPLIVFWVWSAYVFFKRLRLRKWQITRESECATIAFPSGSKTFVESEIQRAIQELSRSRSNSVSDLWPERTVVATVENAGWFTPVYRARKSAPEYLILIERSARRDQQARLLTDLVFRLRQGQAKIHLYYFQRDPRTSFEEESGRAVALSELTARYGHCQLFVYAAVSIFFSRLTGKFHTWLATLDQWPSRVLLSPAPPAEWGRSEQRLVARGYEVLPAHPRGLARLVEVLTHDELHHYPTSLATDTRRWTEPPPRPAAEIGQLLYELRMYLGDDGFRWLSACAIYPVIEWELTQQLGDHLVPSQRYGELLSKLVRLPWLRVGSMPDWLRLAFMRRMDVGLRDTIARFLSRLLGDTPLGSPAQTPHAGHKIVLRRRGRGAVDDEVFLSFIWGRDPKDLTLRAPTTFRRLLFVRGRAWLGLRPWAWFVTSLACSTIIWFGSGRRHVPPDHRQAPPLAAPDPYPRVVVDIAASQLHDPSYFLASQPSTDMDFPQWCYRVAALVLNRGNPLGKDRPYVSANSKAGDVVSVGKNRFLVISGTQVAAKVGLVRWAGSRFQFQSAPQSLQVAVLDSETHGTTMESAVPVPESPRMSGRNERPPTNLAELPAPPDATRSKRPVRPISQPLTGSRQQNSQATLRTNPDVSTASNGTGCDSSLWSHVYHKTRLAVLQPCTTVTGRVHIVRREPDGDLHVQLTPDPQFSGLLNAINKSKQHNALVIEQMCDHPPRQPDAVSSCQGFSQKFAALTEGAHVKVTGSYVEDHDPNHGWREIHPITAVELVP